MIEAKSGNLAMMVEPTKLSGDVSISLSFKSKASGCCINRLKCMSECGCYPVGVEEACVWFALYLKVRNGLAGSPTATMKSKVGAVWCGYNGGHFYINWHVKGNGSAIAKSVRVALKSLTPGAVFSTYAQLIQQLGEAADRATFNAAALTEEKTPKLVKQFGGRADRSEFNAAAEAVGKSIKSLVHCAIIGNVKITAEVLKTIATALSAKIPAQDVKGPKSESKEHKECYCEGQTLIPVHGWQASILKDYISMSKLQGLRTAIHGNELLVNMEKTALSSAFKKIKDGVNAFVESKYATAKEHMNVLLGLRMLQSGEVSGVDVQDMLRKGLKPSDLEKAINMGLAKV